MSQATAHFRVARQDGPPTARRNDLVAIEAEAGNGRQGPAGPALILAADCFGGIFDDWDLPAVGDFQ